MQLFAFNLNYMISAGKFEFFKHNQPNPPPKFEYRFSNFLKSSHLNLQTSYSITIHDSKNAFAHLVTPEETNEAETFKSFIKKVINSRKNKRFKENLFLFFTLFEKIFMIIHPKKLSQLSIIVKLTKTGSVFKQTMKNGQQIKKAIWF